MTNFEFYKDEIQKITECDDVTVAIVDDKPVPCDSVHSCKRCLFNGMSCAKGITKWLYKEHVEKPTITPQEKKFLELCKPGCYVVRDKNGCIYVSTAKPKKSTSGWDEWIAGGEYLLLDKNWNHFIQIWEDSFSFITWEDKEPWSVEDLLKLEVKE